MDSKKTIRIFLVDDNRTIRQALTKIINSQPDMKVVAEAKDGKAVVATYGKVRPDVTLIDLNMPEVDGIQAISNIRNSFPQARIIVITSCDTASDIEDSYATGADAFVLKDLAFDKMLPMIRAVHGGQRFVPQSYQR
jgi:DNA-binding NarL/FixJ family response regulator